MAWNASPWAGSAGSRYAEPQAQSKLDEVRVPDRKPLPQADGGGARRRPPVTTATAGSPFDSPRPGEGVPAREDRETLLGRVGGDAACAGRLIAHARTRCPSDPVGTAAWQLYRDRRSWR
jgi:hypothetical protein